MTLVLADSTSTTAADEIQTLYTDDGGGTIITSFAATNNSESNKTYEAFIFNQDGSVKEAVVPLKILVRDRYDLGPPITNQLIPSGGSLRVRTSAIGSPVFRVTGEKA